MRLLTAIVALAIASAALRAATTVIALMLVGVAMLKPVETLKLIAGLMCLGMIAKFPVPAMALLAVTVIAGKLTDK